MFRFQDIHYLWLLLVPIFIVLLFIISEKNRKKQIAKIGNHRLVNLLIPLTSIKRRIWKLSLIVLALVFIIIGIARPQFGSKLKEVKTNGIEIIVAMDVSNSMLSQDIKPNRLDNAKRIVEKIINNLGNNKIGLIVFAGNSFVQMPLTDDVRAGKMYLQNISTNSVPSQGTAIGEALDMASKSFSSNSELAKLIILITDGENHEDDPIEEAKKLKEKGIKVFCIGMGSPKGSPISLKNGKGFLKDRDGNVVMSALDEKTLIAIADETSGSYIRANNSLSTVDNIASEIDKIEKGEITKNIYSDYDEKFLYFALLALILLSIEAIVSEQKILQFKKFNLFNTKEKTLNQ